MVDLGTITISGLIGVAGVIGVMLARSKAKVAQETELAGRVKGLEMWKDDFRTNQNDRYGNLATKIDDLRKKSSEEHKELRKDLASLNVKVEKNSVNLDRLVANEKT